MSAVQKPITTPARKGTVTPLDRWWAWRLVKAIPELPLSLILWNGEEIGNDPSEFRITISSRYAMYKLTVNPVVGFGDLYSDGYIELDGDLVAFFDAVYRVGADQGMGRFGRFLNRSPGWGNNGTRARCKRNTFFHYELGNDFYQLWLDRAALQYTCAYFSRPELGLEAAQKAKMHYICRKLRLKPGQRVIEAGCGWGGMACYMAKHYGVLVEAYNISHEQVVYARRHAIREGLANRIEYIEDDYRAIQGDCDVFVSVGMLEHIGPKHYRELGRVINRCLKGDGLGLIHTIGRNRAAPTNVWTEKRIFPGAYLPTLREIMELFEPWSFSVLDVENLRLHYAETLRHWLQRFDRHADQVRQRYDDRFVRTWRLYLSGSIAAFACGDLQLFQLLFARPRSNVLPWTREDLYRN